MTLRARLSTLYPDASGRSLKQWLEGGRVRVNGQIVRRGDVGVGATDRVELTAPPPPAFPAPLRLVHEDDDLLVIDKPPGLLTISTESERERTAYRLVRDWLQARGTGRIFVVHRLDRETSGLVVFARTPAAKEALQSQFKARQPQRVYVARVEGRVRDETGTLVSRLHEDRSLRVRAAARRHARRSRSTACSRACPTPRCSSSRWRRDGADRSALSWPHSGIRSSATAPTAAGRTHSAAFACTPRVWASFIPTATAS